jgi:prolyl oligopeptidase
MPIYPETRCGEDYADPEQRVPDPYQWLERRGEEVERWVAAQNALTSSELSGLTARDPLRHRLGQLWNYPRRSSPIKRGGRYFELRNSGLQDQNVLYVCASLGDPGRVLLDPNLLSSDGTVALATWSVSRDGRLLAYALSQAGSDWLTWRVRDVASGEDLADSVPWSKFSQAAWLPDGSGFLYGRYQAPEAGAVLSQANYGQQLVLHRLGEDPALDQVLLERPEHPEWGFHPQFSQDGRYLFVTVTRGTFRETQIWVNRLADGLGRFGPRIDAFGALYEVLGSVGDQLYLRTSQQAPLGRVVSLDLTSSGSSLQPVVAEGGEVLERALLSGDGLVLAYLHHGQYRLARCSLQGGQITPVDFPPLSTLTAWWGEYGEDELLFGSTSLTSPEVVYRYRHHQGSLEVQLPAGLSFDPADFSVRQVLVTSPDGTRLPVFLMHRRDLRPGPAPTLLYGYGGFGIAVTPTFSASMLAWAEQGGVYVQACLRGGSEYGEEWYRAGTLERKQNVFDDFIACAEWLTDQGVTTPSRLAITGASNGGLLVGAAMTQRPELFGVALPRVGVLDMLRFHRFTIGWAWISDYGSPDDPAMFGALRAYSPLHNLRRGTCYPATLIATGDHDDRVVPAHSYKFAAALQAAQGCARPVLIRIQTRAGHGAGKPVSMQVAEMADLLAFALAHLQGPA